MRMRLLTLLFIIGLTAPVIGQQINVREQVHLQVNTDFLITGETLYFSAFVTSSATGLLSHLSSTLYVELVGEEDKPLFQQKIKLENGRGHGEFFVPSLASTGTYQLIAYTRWMKSFDDYFQSRLTIVNPFEEYVAPETGRLSLDFYPESGGLLMDQSNDVVFYLSNNLTGIPASGKVVNGAGDKISDIQANQEGFGRFSMTPRPGVAYQAIIEDANGDFHFFNLPDIVTQQNIHIAESAGFFTISVGSGEDKLVRLSVTDGQNTIVSEEIETNKSIRVYKKNLKPGMYRAAVQGSERIFVYQGPQSDAPYGLGQYGQRSLVQAELVVASPTTAAISVRKIDQGNPTNIQESVLFAKTKNPIRSSVDLDMKMISSQWKGQASLSRNDSVKYLPEVRGNLISGKIHGSAEMLREVLVTYSLIGEHYQIRAAKPDQNKQFTIQIDPIEGNQDAYLSLLGADSSVSFTLDKPFLTSYPEFEYVPVSIDSLTAAVLTKRSIRNQVQNAYFKFQPESDSTTDSTPEQFGEYSNLYVLDDFNRFPKMHEHFIEFIPEVVARHNNTRSKLKVLPRHILPYDLDPLILVDGVPTTPEQVLSFSPYKIKSIGVINNRIFNGPLVADGLVSFHTFRGDMHGFEPGINGVKLIHQGWEPVKDYQFPEYGQDQSRDRIPDFRDQLYWQPNVYLGAEKPYMLEFYTSDTTGEFDIVVEGFSEDGQPVSIIKTFTVKTINPPASN